MASSINASVTSTGIVQTADASGILQLQSDGTTGLSVNSGGKVVYANTALSTASAGTLEYDGKVPYFTPSGTQRGVIPGMQYYRLDSGLVGTATSSAQSLFGVGCTVSANTVYKFEMLLTFTKTATATAHTISLGFAGTATFNNILYMSNGLNINSALPVVDTTLADAAVNAATATVITELYGAATQTQAMVITGTFSIGTGGTVIPQYTTSSSVGPYTLNAGSFVSIYPIGTAGSNTSVGTWA